MTSYTKVFELASRKRTDAEGIKKKEKSYERIKFLIPKKKKVCYDSII